MKKDIAYYIERCMECQKVKVEHKHIERLLQPLPIVEWTIDFITKLSRIVRQHDSIMVVVNKLHFILVKSTHRAFNITDI